MYIGPREWGVLDSVSHAIYYLISHLVGLKFVVFVFMPFYTGSIQHRVLIISLSHSQKWESEWYKEKHYSNATTTWTNQKQSFSLNATFWKSLRPVHIHRSKLRSTLLDGCTSSKVLCMGLLSKLDFPSQKHKTSSQVARGKKLCFCIMPTRCRFKKTGKGLYYE